MTFLSYKLYNSKKKESKEGGGKKKKKSDAICDQNTYACNWMPIEVARLYINTIL
jgi:hypothetical protein